MKTKRILSLISVVSMALAIQSCSFVKNTDFAQRKYTKFRKSEDKVQLVNSNTTPKTISKNTTVVNTVQPTHEEIALNLTNVIENNLSEVSVIANNEKPISGNKVKSFTKKAIAKSLITFAKRVSCDFTGKKNTTSVKSDDQLLLLILAILIPPLAVYLVAGLGTEFWLDLLLTLLFFIPGMIYAIIVVLG